MRRAAVARQVVGASGTWRPSNGHSEEALVTWWPPANSIREEKGDEAGEGCETPSQACSSAIQGFLRRKCEAALRSAQYRQASVSGIVDDVLPLAVGAVWQYTGVLRGWSTRYTLLQVAGTAVIRRSR